jgi:hypothetical protein
VAHRRLASLLVLVPLALPASALAHFRLQGEFMMSGRITVAHDVPGEHVGERVARVWSFVAPCPVGQCVTEKLTRSRVTGQDKLTLRRPKARVYSHWVGKGSFYAPLMCGSRVYPRGERVFFRIKVRILRAPLINGLQNATVIKASYTNYRRTNRTRCVAALGRDAAVYTGTLVMPAPAPAPPAPTPAPG